MFALIVIGLVVMVIAIICYRRMTWGVCHSQADMTGKTVLITGANSGIGYCTALDLAARNARVILVCLEQNRGQDAMKKIHEETGNEKLVVKQVDLSSQSSVRRLAAQIKKEEKRLDVLINNAGVLTVPYKMVDGFEYTYATNYFGPFLLTNLLLELLKKTPGSRIVNVTSMIYSWGRIEFDNLRAERSYSRYTAYANTKMAIMLFTRELSKRLKGTGVTVNVLHPGSIVTNLYHYMPLLGRLALTTFGFLFWRSAEQGAQTSIYLAVSEEVEGVSGKYFSECKITAQSNRAQDDAVARKLWEISERLTGL